MHSFLKQYGDTEGPLGFPMKDADAKRVEALMKGFPDAKHVRVVVQKATTEFNEGERADVSWIQTEAIDHDKEIVLASGLDDTLFKDNPIVTVNHNYCQPPVGKSLWRKKTKDGDRRGVKAKTLYPVRPEEWTEEHWAPDYAWALVKSGLMTGKSIGFLTLKAHQPTDQEIKKRPELANVRRIIDQWALLEYACCWLPTNPEALVDAVAKSLVTKADLKFIGAELPPPVSVVPFTPLTELAQAVCRAFGSIDVKSVTDKLVRNRSDRARGRV